MELQHLRVFLRTAEEGSIAKAAQALHISAPALSRQIARLEDELGVPLFTRLGRGVRLTAAGIAYQKGARVVLAEVRRSEVAAHAAARGVKGTFRIGVAETSAYLEAIPDIIADFKQRHPAIICKVLHVDWPEVAGALTSGRLQAAFCVHHPLDSEFAAEVLFRERLYLVAARGHPLAQKESALLSQMRAEQFISIPPAVLPRSFRELGAELIAHGVSLAEALEAPGPYTQVGLAAAGLGVAILPKRKRMPPHPDVAFVPLPDLKFRAPNVLTWQEASTDSPLITSLRDVARKLAPSLTDEAEVDEPSPRTRAR